ncbi:hypothetical protein [Streptomyces sp. NPDC051677]|uniref:hypothetical protein n=1 Tax=Streptomyces sp. NPDC051677 TaxID=3365669 RepID=UPI0037D1A1C9
MPFLTTGPMAVTGQVSEVLTAMIWSEINDGALEFLARAQREGLLAPDADLVWVRRVYYALVDEALHGSGADQDPDQGRKNADVLATLIVDTLLRGVGLQG